MEHDGHRQRIRERFCKEGLGGFAPHEALEFLLTYAIPRKDVNPLAHQLIAHFGSFHAVLEASCDELKKVDGVGEQAATLITSVIPLFRLYQQDRLGEKAVIRNRQQAEEYALSYLEGMTTEHFYAVCMDTKMRVLNTSLISEGTPDEVAVYPRLVLNALLKVNASGLLMMHNHPSGTLIPSNEDIIVTQRIADVLSGVHIQLFDHIIVAAGQTYSFHRNGLLVHEDEEIPIAATRERQLPPRLPEKRNKKK